MKNIYIVPQFSDHYAYEIYAKGYLIHFFKEKLGQIPVIDFTDKKFEFFNLEKFVPNFMIKREKIQVLQDQLVKQSAESSSNDIIIILDKGTTDTYIGLLQNYKNDARFQEKFHHNFITSIYVFEKDKNLAFDSIIKLAKILPSPTGIDVRIDCYDNEFQYKVQKLINPQDFETFNAVSMNGFYNWAISFPDVYDIVDKCLDNMYVEFAKLEIK